MAHSYKALKEDFVSNLSGGGIWEITVVTLVAPVRSSASGKCNWAHVMCTVSCSAVVGPSVSSRVIRPVWACGVCNRPSTQRRGDPPRNDTILFCAHPTQPVALSPCYNSIHGASFDREPEKAFQATTAQKRSSPKPK